MKLKMSPDLALPLEAVTEKIAFLGRTGSGKTYAAMKLAEEMHRVDAQFVVLDPVGVWNGLRWAADGKAPGLPIPVLGGLRGDIPLEATGGALLANLVVDSGQSMVLDVSQFESDADKARFAQAFADRFFFRKKAAPSAVHLFIEEAQEFVPQNPQREEARMLHAFTRMVKIGRNFGIGVSLISQRPQEVNKKVLNLTELLFCFQLTGPQERKTIQGWIAEKGIDEDIAGELPKLDVGQPHVWSPAWLKISERVRIAPKKTLDVSSTPTVGRKAAARDLSPIDLEGLRKEMAATIERAKAEDPRELRKQLAEVRAELARVRVAPAAKGTTKTVEIPVLKAADIKRLEGLVAHVDRALTKAADWRAALDSSSQELRRAAVGISDELRALRVGRPSAPSSPEARLLQAVRPVLDRKSAHELQRATFETKRILGGGGGGGALPAGETKVLTAMAQHGPAGVTREQLTILTGYKRSTRDAYVQCLRARGFVEVAGDRIVATDAGVAALGPDFALLPTGDALREHWLARLPLGERAVLVVLIESYPNAIDRERISEKTGYKRSTRDAYLQRLDARRLIIQEGRGQVRAAQELFG